ncbi:MAG: hypothetical protein ACTSR0_05810 [Candidatus Asgardarchaeia archaeon]
MTGLIDSPQYSGGDLLIVVFNQTGGLVFKKFWGGKYADAEWDIFLVNEYEIYVAGHSTSYATSSILLIKYGKDSDVDGLADTVEANVGTDPNDPDTDGDGFIDGNDPNPTNSLIPISLYAAVLSLFAIVILLIVRRRRG